MPHSSDNNKKDDQQTDAYDEKCNVSTADAATSEEVAHVLFPRFKV